MSFKEFNQATDISTQLSVINEIMPLTGVFFSGADYYVQNYVNITSGSVLSGGFWETIFDGSPTSISSSALVDLTFGFSSASLLVSIPGTFLINEKQRVYKEMASRLLGDFNSLFTFNNVVYNELFFILFKRRIFKDEIKKGSISLLFQMTGALNGDQLTLIDIGATSVWDVGVAGDEANIYSGSTPIGKVYYNAGIVAISTGALVPVGLAGVPYWSGSHQLNQSAISGNIDHIVNGLRNRINDIQFQNQTNLHSTIYFCRALNSDFNYSTNPSFIDSDGRIVVTSGSDNQTRSYITTIGLYDINDNLLAVSKASEPVKKSPDNELIFRVKLSY